MSKIYVYLDTAEQTSRAIEYERNHEKIKFLIFETANGSNNCKAKNSKDSSIKQQNFVNFLEFLAAKPALVTLRDINFKGPSIGPNDATLLSKVINKIDSPSITLRFACQTSEDAFGYIMSQYANQGEIKQSRHGHKKQHQNNRLIISGSGIKCEHIKCLNQEFFSSIFGSLAIYNTEISDDGAISLSSALRQNTTITSLDLSNNNIGTLGGQAIGNMLCENSCLKSLDLSDNEIGNGGVIQLAKSLQINSSLEELTLEAVGCGDDGMIALADGLTRNCRLDRLELKYNRFKGELKVLEAFAKSLKQNSTLTFLGLEDAFSENYNGQIIGSFVHALNGKTTELEIDFSQNTKSQIFDDHACNTLVQCNAPLLTLDIGNNKLRPNHIDIITQAIQEQTFNIKSLVLDHAQANDDCIVKLFDVLIERKTSCNLVGLSFGFLKGITNIGAQHIVDRIPLTNLECLELDKFPIGNDGVQQIASYLNDTKLRKLRLMRVGMEDSGMIALSNALKSNIKLVYLGIYEKFSITDLGRQALLHTLKEYNMTLKEIYVWGWGKKTIIVDKMIAFYSELNKAKRKYLCDPNFVPVKMYPFIFESVHDKPSVMYWILQTSPHIFF